MYLFQNFKHNCNESLQQRKDNPIVTVYEKWPNLADHEKIQGTDHGGFSQDLH
jgi:hypothetical protein